MLSLKTVGSSIISGVLLVCMACSGNADETTHFKRINTDRAPLFHAHTIGTIAEPPAAFPEIWNRTALQLMGVKQITLVAKGGKNPDDTLEMVRFSYADDWKKLTYTQTHFDGKIALTSTGSLNYAPGLYTGSIRFKQLFGVKKQVKTTIQTVENGYLLLQKKRADRYDSTWVIGSFTHPRAIVSKIGNSLLSVQLFVPDGSGTSAIKAAYDAIPQLNGQFPAASCSVVFTENGRPLSAFQLNEQFSQVAQTGEWVYKNKLLTGYTEWFGNSEVRTILLHYANDSQLPTTVTIDRNTYFCHYE